MSSNLTTAELLDPQEKHFVWLSLLGGFQHAVRLSKVMQHLAVQENY